MEVFGANDQHLRVIRQFFPKLVLVARGDTLKAMGDVQETQRFAERFQEFVAHIARYHEASPKVIEDIMSHEGPASDAGQDPGTLVHGNNGLHVRARTPGQQRLVEAVTTNDMVFAVGPAGTGKTYTAVALAVRALKERKVRRIILTRPAVEAGENLGFLPGDLREKLDPYLQPLYDALRDMLPPPRLAEYMDAGVIQIAPLAFMRGRTLDNAFVILDEAQNATLPQIKMFLTRMGRSATFVITGDVTQIDLPDKQRSGLVAATELLRGVEGIAVVDLDVRDVVRHELVTRVLLAFAALEGDKNQAPR
jgi:phosphate starvation-inducible protein PhoH and related proteins